ncbi:MAG: cupin domain-containing protein [Pseudodonghicola sp.]
MHTSGLGPGSVEWLGTHYRTWLSATDSDGGISVVESVSPPDCGPPCHIHDDADETFLLMSGDCEFWLEGERFFRSPGQAVFIPRGREHSFRVVGRLPGRHLIVLTPGGFEGFFAAMAAGGHAIPGDMEEIGRIAADFHLRFTGPPLAD